MTTLKRLMVRTALATLLCGSGLHAQEQPGPAAPEPDEAAPPANQETPAAPLSNPFAPPSADPATEPPPVAPPAEPPPSEPPPTEPAPATPPTPATPPLDPPLPQQPVVPYSALPARPAVAAVTPPEDPFLPPDGMVTPPECLIDLLGFFGHHPFVYSDSNCFDLASAAYRYGYFLDAIALLSHAIEQYPQADYYYLRGMAQMKAGLGHDAIASADGVLDAIAAGNYGGLDRVSERFNGPLGKQFQELLDLRRAAR